MIISTGKRNVFIMYKDVCIWLIPINPYKMQVWVTLMLMLTLTKKGREYIPKARTKGSKLETREKKKKINYTSLHPQLNI